MEKHDEGGVGAELTRLLSGDNRKSCWLLGGIIGTAMVATWLAPRLGWHVSRLRLQLGLAAVWFVILLLASWSRFMRAVNKEKAAVDRSNIEDELRELVRAPRALVLHGSST